MGAEKKPYIAVRPVNHPGVVPNQAIWRGSNALPYWSYQGCDGNEAEIEVYTTAYEVELFVNGRSVDRVKTEDYTAEFRTIYEPGELRAVALNRDGSIHSENSLFSADGNTKIQILPEEDNVKRGDILYLDISLIGENSEIECNRDTKLGIAIEGGELLAFGSANPKTEETFLSGIYTTYYGRSQAVIKICEEQVHIRVSGEGIAPADTMIRVTE